MGKCLFGGNWIEINEKNVYNLKLGKIYILYVDFANATWRDRLPTFDLIIENCQSCNVFKL